MKPKNRKAGRMYRLSLSTLIAVYLLILAGGIVRSTGSGMGCPDWPKCFGSYVPPTNESQLPDNYLETYKEQRHQKLFRLAGYVEQLGFNRLAHRMRTEESMLIETEFNAAKTWIEYVNRLLGAIIGLMVLATAFYSLKFWNSDRSIPITASLILILTLFQGWIGSVVVATNLLPGTVTLHMLLALVIIMLLVLLLVKTRRREKGISLMPVSSGTRRLLMVALALMFVQLILGTQVRQAIDRLVATEVDRQEWIEALGGTFLIHRSFSLLIAGVFGVLVWRLYKKGRENIRRNRLYFIILGLILAEIITGAVMAYAGVPPSMQPVHLLLASLIIGGMYYLIIVSKPSTEQEVQLV